MSNVIVAFASCFTMLCFHAVLYAFFGVRLLYIAWRSNSKVSQQKEFEEGHFLELG